MEVPKWWSSLALLFLFQSISGQNVTTEGTVAINTAPGAGLGPGLGAGLGPGDSCNGHDDTWISQNSCCECRCKGWDCRVWCTPLTSLTPCPEPPPDTTGYISKNLCGCTIWKFQSCKHKKKDGRSRYPGWGRHGRKHHGGRTNYRPTRWKRDVTNNENHREMENKPGLPKGDKREYRQIKHGIRMGGVRSEEREGRGTQKRKKEREGRGRRNGIKKDDKILRDKNKNDKYRRKGTRGRLTQTDKHRNNWANRKHRRNRNKTHKEGKNNGRTDITICSDNDPENCTHAGQGDGAGNSTADGWSGDDTGDDRPGGDWLGDDDDLDPDQYSDDWPDNTFHYNPHMNLQCYCTNINDYYYDLDNDWYDDWYYDMHDYDDDWYDNWYDYLNYYDDYLNYYDDYLNYYDDDWNYYDNGSGMDGGDPGSVESINDEEYNTMFAESIDGVQLQANDEHNNKDKDKCKCKKDKSGKGKHDKCKCRKNKKDKKKKDKDKKKNMMTDSTN